MKEAIDYLKELFEIDNNTTATILITISVFLIGLIFQAIYQLIRNYLKRHRHRRMLIHLLRETSKSSLIQGEYFMQLANTLNIEYLGHFSLISATLGYLSVLEKIDFELSYSAFFHGIENLCSKGKLKAFTKAQTVISKTIGIEKNYPDDLKTFIDKFNRYEDKWNDAIELVRQQFEEIFAQIKLNPQLIQDENQAKFFTEMDKIIYGWQNSENRTHYFVAFNKLIEPLRVHFRKPEYETIAIQLKGFSNQLISAELYYQNMVNTLAVYYVVFENYGRIYRNNKRLLKLIIEKLN